MILHHVTQGAGVIVKIAARFNADLFRDRNLHIFNPRAIPQWFQEQIGKAQRQQVLHHFFAEVMIDTVDLVFLQIYPQRLVDFARRCSVATERLFYHHTR